MLNNNPILRGQSQNCNLLAFDCDDNTKFLQKYCLMKVSYSLS